MSFLLSRGDLKLAVAGLVVRQAAAACPHSFIPGGSLLLETMRNVSFQVWILIITIESWMLLRSLRN